MFITEQLKAYKKLFPNETKTLKPLFSHIEKNINSLYDRKNLPGHITGSSFVIEDNHLLCIYHPYIKKWFQPGGHVEEGENPEVAALREVVEETGLHTTLHPWHDLNNIPFDIDIHHIAANDKKNEADHYHYDFRFLCQIDHSKDSLPSELTYKWVPLEQLEDDLLKIVQKLRVNDIYQG